MELIDQGHRNISRRVDLTRARVLGLVAEHGPLRPNEIAAALDLTASATSRHLAALERAGRVAVEPDQFDARTFLVRSTSDGEAEVDATVQAGVAAFTAVTADWSDEDIATARTLIARLNQAWAQRNAAPSEAGPRWRQARRR
ncbi:DNA-binding MarR family transcriptional regulator [Kutzneria buriramensis]|uniref:DNA-binding MarR family transcriptional regulator n=2 Tax=Kutzneria buriramensis TaxID=1045776 RepID=A0A3E0H7L5_9PSEU|nr:DNA-binding MarR family transcriptional regulator [Kutzneria buriramensis]